jgi:hypothetical protein
MKKKIFYIISIILAPALIVTGVIFLFVINYGVKKPDAVAIVSANSKTYIKTSINDSAYGYIFKFRDGDNEITIETRNNMLCADNLINDGTINLGTDYKVSVCYKNQYENGYSGYSQEIDWLASLHLEATELYVYPTYDIENDLIYDECIMWSEVENADKYIVYYSCGNDTIKYETNATYLDLRTIEGGSHNFYVVATSEQDKYLDSPISNVVKATSYYELHEFTSAKLVINTEILTIYGKEDLNDLEIMIGSNQNDAQTYHYSYQDGGTAFHKIKVDGGYQFMISISTIYSGEEYVVVRPKAVGYTLFNGGVTRASLI